ncbi:UNVERIFIED_CONTAM: hypothetical protein RMT77_013859 [Armadillidium vulgare]
MTSSSGELTSEQLQQLYLCSLLLGKKREQPIFTCKAHVFHIDPKTKRSWIPASSSAVSVSFFYDSTRQLYRIISVEGTKAVINSTITPNMMFTKTSQKFGQWSDMRANTVYGLGFSTEAELNKFIEKFQDVKEATRSGKTNGTMGGGTVVGVNPGSMSVSSGVGGGGMVSTTNICLPPVASTTGGTSSATASPLTSRAKSQDQPPSSDVNSLSTELMDLIQALEYDLVRVTLGKHSSMQQTGESPKHKGSVQQGGEKSQVDSQAQLKYENDRLKLALAQSSANAKKWEIELNSLKTTNARLTSALQESTANVEEWKKQLQTYKEENARMKSRVLELEAGNSGRDVDDVSQELASLRIRVETLSEELVNRDATVEELRSQVQRARTEELKERIQMLTEEKEQLRMEVSHTQSQLEVAMGTQETQRGVVESVNLQLGERIKDLLALHHELNHLLTT